eukprot:8645769-Pyramimonas_sp.AAC.1
MPAPAAAIGGPVAAEPEGGVEWRVAVPLARLFPALSMPGTGAHELWGCGGQGPTRSPAGG